MCRVKHASMEPCHAAKDTHLSLVVHLQGTAKKCEHERSHGGHVPDVHLEHAITYVATAHKTVRQTGDGN